jgi:hypothetical protein
LKPKSIFLIDAIGAFVTAFLLFFILRRLNEYIGITKNLLTCLTLIALLFCIYSLTCFFVLKDNWQPFLRIISTANLLYCALTTGILLFHFKSMTTIGITYFTGEIIVISGLVFYEFKILKDAEQKK